MDEEDEERNLVAVQWPARRSFDTVRQAIEEGREVEIALPAGTHYALYRHLHPGESGAGADEVEAAGGVDLLESIATIPGLQELLQLRGLLERARYRVQVTSPEPTLRLSPPASAG